MTQEEINTIYKLQLSRVKENAQTLIDKVEQYDNGTNITGSVAEDFSSEVEEVRDNLNGIIDDLYNNVIDEVVEEDIDDEEYEDTADLRPSDADKDEAEAVND